MAEKLATRRAVRKEGLHNTPSKTDEKPSLIEEQRAQEIASRPVSSLDLGDQHYARRVVEHLRAHGIDTIGELAKANDSDLLSMKGISTKTVSRLRHLLADLGLPGTRTEPYIRLKQNGDLDTNLSHAQLHTLIKLSRLELGELSETVRPEKLKVIRELFSILEIVEITKGYEGLGEKQFTRLLKRTMEKKGLVDESELKEAEPELYRVLARRRPEQST